MIAVIEAAMAVIGLRTLISKKAERVRRDTLDRIDGLDKEVTKRAREVVNDKLTETFHSDLNYRSLLSDLAEGFDLHQVQEMADMFPEQYRDIGLVLAQHATGVVDALQKLAPRSFYETITGAKHLLPSDVKVWQFVTILEVLDDPMLVFPLMNTGALLKSQAAAVRQLYPTLSEAIDKALFAATVKAKTAKKSFELAPRAEVGVSAWIATSPTASPDVAVQRQKRLAASQDTVKRAKAQTEQRAAKAQADKQAAMAETPTQRDPARGAGP